MKKLVYLALVVVSAGLPGCLKTTATSGSIGINPDNVTVAAGTHQSFSAILTGGLANSSVKWTLVGAACASAACGSIDQSGNYSAPMTVPSQPAIQVIATTTSQPIKSAFANVIIAPPVSITFTSQPATLSVAAGQQLFPFQVSIINTSNTNVNWSVTGAGCTGVACGTIIPISPVAQATPITYTAPSTLPNPPVVTVTATSAADPTKSVPLNVNLTLAVQITPNAPSVFLLGFQPFAANVVGQGANPVTASWSLSQGGVRCAPACGIIDGNGNYLGPFFPINPNTVTVTAAVTAGPFSGTGSTTLTISGAAPTPLFGTYALQYRDYPLHSGNPRVEAGSLFIDASGNIKGVEDDNDGVTPVKQRAITGLAQFDTGSTSTGTMTLSDGLVTTLRFALVPESSLSSSRTVYLSGLNVTTAGGGRLDLQDTSQFSASTLTGGYALMMRGGTNSSLSISTFASAVGRFDLGGGTISNGELGRGFDDTNFGDCNTHKTIVSPPTPLNYPFFGGSYASSGVDSTTGNTTFAMTAVQMGGQNGGTPVSNLTLTFSSYIISATKMILIETDAGGTSGGYAFLGTAEKQTPSHTFANSDFTGTYSTLFQSNNGLGAGNVLTFPVSSDGLGNLTGVEYTGDLDGNLQYGINSTGYYSVVSPNGLALATVCTGINITRIPMYFISAQRAFAWNEDATNLTVNPTVSLASDLVGTLDLQVNGPFGGQGETGFSATPYAFGFEGVAGNFSTSHSTIDGIAETGIVVFNTGAPKCVIISPPLNSCTVGTNGVLEQTGTATFKLDLADGAGTLRNQTLNAVFTFNDAANGVNSDGVGFGSLKFSSAAIPVPDHFLMISPQKILLLYCGTAAGSPPACKNTDSNIAGVIEQH